MCEFFAITVYVAAEENLCDAGLQIRLIREADRWSECTVCVPTAATEECTLAANEPGHLSEDDDTAGSQPNLMQWVNVTDLVVDAS